MVRRLIPQLFICALCAGLPVPRAQANPASPSPWRIQQGKWEFGADGELTCLGSTYSSILYYKQPPLSDLELAVEVLFLKPSSSAGLFFRAAGKRFYEDTTFYQFEWYTAGRHHSRRLSLMVKNPKWKQIVTPTLRDAPLNQWIALRVRAKGDHLQAFVDGKEVFSVHDKTYLRKGEAGLHVFMPTSVRFRNFLLRPLSE